MKIRTTKQRKQLQMPGCNRHNVSAPTKADLARINQAYENKVEEYEQLSLEELEKLEKDSKLSNTYRVALQHTIMKKKYNMEAEETEETSE